MEITNYILIIDTFWILYIRSHALPEYLLLDNAPVSVHYFQFVFLNLASIINLLSKFYSNDLGISQLK